MTLNDLFENSCKRYSNNPLIAEKYQGEYTYLSYRKAGEKVNELARALVHHGYRIGEKGVLLSEGRNYWLFAELAMLKIGMVSVPISIRIEENEDLIFRINHSESTIVFVSHRHVQKIRNIRSRIPAVKMVIIIDLPFDFSDVEPGNEILLSDFLKRTPKNPELEETIINTQAQINKDTPVNISYTSGTTSDPKGIVLTHDNYITNVDQSTAMVDVEESFTTLLLLPWDHSFAHTVGLYSLIKCGASMASAETGNSPMETLRNIPKNLQEIKPTFLLSVPALAKNFKNNIESGIQKKGSFAWRLFRTGLIFSYHWQGDGSNKGKGLRILSLPFHLFFDRILYSKIRVSFGGNLRFFIGGGALLDKEYQEFFHAIGIPMFQGYGLSEASPVISTNSFKAYKFGTSGKVVPNLKVEIVDQERKAVAPGETGEIVVSGNNVMHSYWRNPKASAETLVGKTLYTGDMGYIDKQNYLIVSGRYKSLLISGDGEKYSPETIEETIISNARWISQIMLYNHQNPYTIALIYPNIAKVKGLKKEKPSIETAETIIREIKMELETLLKEAAENKIIQTRWFPASFAIIPEPFSEQNKQINSTMKIVRPKIIEHYKDLIAYLYTPEGKNPMNHMNIEHVNKIETKREEM